MRKEASRAFKSHICRGDTFWCCRRRSRTGRRRRSRLSVGSSYRRNRLGHRHNHRGHYIIHRIHSIRRTKQHRQRNSRRRRCTIRGSFRHSRRRVSRGHHHHISTVSRGCFRKNSVHANNIRNLTLVLQPHVHKARRTCILLHVGV